MTLEEEFELSCFQEIAKLNEKKGISLVKKDDRIYVKKKLKLYNRSIYEIIYRLKPKNIPEICFLAEDENCLIIIEEYINGDTIRTILENDGVLNEKRACQIICDLADILMQLQDDGLQIVHRDIKPDNVMITDDGITKLIDFNAARQFSEMDSEDTFYMGTRDYAAPEQYGFGQSDVRTDIYGMGCLLNVMITGRLPKEEACAGKLGKIVSRCTKLEAAERYQSLAELRKDLEKILGSNKKNPAGKNEEVPKENEFNPGHVKKYPYLPIGFRTLTAWKMIVASFGYLFITGVCMKMDLSDRNGRKVTGAGRICYVSLTWIMLIFFVFYFGNYLNLTGKYIGKSRMAFGKILRLILGFVGIFMFFALLILISSEICIYMQG